MSEFSEDQNRETTSVHLVISGRVQGVWYRGWTCREAGRLGLTGWVRNRQDGTVEGVFAGPEDKVSHMIQLCRQGPPAARVDDLRVQAWSGDQPEGFQSLPTM